MGDQDRSALYLAGFSIFGRSLWGGKGQKRSRPENYECVALPLSYCGVPVQIGVEPAGQQARPCPTRRRLSLHHELARPQPPRVGTLLRHIRARATGRKLRRNGVDRAPIVAHWPCNTPNAVRPAPNANWSPPSRNCFARLLELRRCHSADLHPVRAVLRATVSRRAGCRPDAEDTQHPRLQ